MLFNLVERVVKQIESLDLSSCIPQFADELILARQDLFEPLQNRLGLNISRRIVLTLAHDQLLSIKEIPIIVRSMLRMVDQPTTHPAVRCALLGTLAYLVQPRDLIADHLPGGFGFVDDCMILRTTTSEYFDILPSGFSTLERERQQLNLLAVCAPPHRLPEFQKILHGVWQLFYALLNLNADFRQSTIEKFINSPLQVPLSELAPSSQNNRMGPQLTEVLSIEAIPMEEDRLQICLSNGLLILESVEKFTSQ